MKFHMVGNDDFLLQKKVQSRCLDRSYAGDILNYLEELGK